MTGQTGTKRAGGMLLALCASLGLTACGSGPTDAVTILRGASGVIVTAADGSPHRAVDGERLVVGETVTTTGLPTVLDTGGRVTTVGSFSSLRLVGRSSYLLQDGAAVVDRRHGPTFVLTAGTVTVNHVGRTAVRVEHGYSVRVAVFDGGSAQVMVGARTRDVTALHELEVPGGSLPAQAAPLALRDDALDLAASPELVAEDLALRGRAAGLDGPGGSVVGVALVAEAATLLPAALGDTENSGLPVSERVLSLAIARSVRGVSPAVAYQATRDLRVAGGSWGVVARLVAAPLASVEQQITLLADGAPGLGGTPPPAGSGTVTLAGHGGGSTVSSTSPASSPVSAPTSGGASPSPEQSPAPGGSTSPSPSPSPSSSPGPVSQLLTAVTGLLPLPLGATSSSTSAASPTGLAGATSAAPL